MTNQKDKLDVIRDFYDNEYYADVHSHATLGWHTKKVAARLGNMEGREVLDVACGTGEWLDYFRKQGASIAGIDLSQRAVDVCGERFPKGEFCCGPAESLPFADGRFDLITCMGSLEHFLDKGAALSEMRRVAKRGARFLILVPNAGFLTRRLGLYGGTQQVKAREDVFDLSTWTGLLESAGLEVMDRWRDLHPLSWDWISIGTPVLWPVRGAQALALTTWPVAWQYQVYHYCKVANE